jgi:3-deoxy-D-manno-octulosonate 8-phosphate phosphatase (KDO 8-P phosphatase)
LLTLDVDGVLTDGGIVLGGDLEIKRFHVRDGSALKAWSRSGKRIALVTGRRSRAVEVRAAELGIETVVQGATDKWRSLQVVLEESSVVRGAVCYVGDDLPDLVPMQQCGLAAAPADACPEVRAAAHYVTRTPGGRGVVREVVELILRCQGVWRPDLG